MLTLKVYLAESGRVASIDKDFPIYQSQYNNILLNVFVPTSVLSPNFTAISVDSGNIVSPFVSGTALEIASKTIQRNGVFKLSKTYYMRYVKTLKKDNTEYALFERKMPKEFVFYAGAGINAPTMVVNAVNIEYGEIESANITTSTPNLTATVNLPNTVLPITQDYVFTYGTANKWYLNGYEANLLTEYGIIVNGTPTQNDTITLSVVASKPTTISTLTSQEVAYDVLMSSDLDKDTYDANELTSIEAYLNALKSVLDGKQDKIDVSLITTEKSVVGAINGLQGNVIANNDLINANTTDIESLKREIDNIKNIVVTGENYIGTYVYQASSESDMPSDQNLLDYAKSIKGQGYNLQNGDVIIVIQAIKGKPDRRYKYIYNGTTWAYYEILPIETAQNGVGGIVWGTWGVGDTNHTLVDIQDGKIAHIYIYYGNMYRDLHTLISTNTTDIENIESGATTVGHALRATRDALGNNIVNTYLTKAVGATQQYVKDYALPRQFNDTLYLNTDGVNNSFETQSPTTPFRVKKQLVLGNNHIFTANLSGIQYDYQLSAKNGYELYLVCSCNKAYNGTLRVAISYDNEVISADLFPIAFTGAVQKVELSGNFNTIDDIADTIKIVDSNLVTIEVDFITDTSEVIEFECVSMMGEPSYFRLFVDYQAILSAKVVQTTGNSEVNVMSQKAVTEFGTPTNVNLTESETRVTYDTEDGIKMVSVSEDIRANGEIVNYNTELTIPLEVEGDLSIDAVENGTKIAIAGASKLLLTLITPQQTTGTLTEEQLAFLQAKDSNYIEIDDGEGHIEKYYYNTNATTSGYRVYAHIEDEPNLIIKSFTIILSVRSWTIQSYDITELLNGKLDKATSVVGGFNLYGTKYNDPTTQMWQIDSGNAMQSKIPMYWLADNAGVNESGKGCLVTSTPKHNAHATNKKYVDDISNGKVDKVTTAYKVYGTDENGNQKVYPTGWSASSGILQIMDYTPNGGYDDKGDFDPYINGSYRVGIPYRPSHATPKKWVEDNFTVYKHIVSFSVYDYGLIDCHFVVYSSQSTPFTTTLPNGVYAGWSGDLYNFLISNDGGIMYVTRLRDPIDFKQYLLGDELFIDSDIVTKL